MLWREKSSFTFRRVVRFVSAAVRETLLLLVHENTEIKKFVNSSYVDPELDGLCLHYDREDSECAPWLNLHIEDMTEAASTHACRNG